MRAMMLLFFMGRIPFPHPYPGKRKKALAECFFINLSIIGMPGGKKVELKLGDNPAWADAERYLR